jgi:hypothetical protein
MDRGHKDESIEVSLVEKVKVLPKLCLFSSMTYGVMVEHVYVK